MNNFIQTIVPQIKNQNAFYSLGLFVTLVPLLFDLSLWSIPEIVRVIIKCIAGFWLCLILVASLPKYKSQVLWIVLCICILSYIGIVIDNSFRILALTAFVVGARNHNFANILKIYFCVSSIFLLLTVGGSIIGLVENYAVYSFSFDRLSLSSFSDGVRLCYGYGWPTSMPAHCSFILLTYWYLKKGVLSKIDWLVFGGIIGLLILYTDARLGTYSIFLILFATIFYNFTNRICRNKKNCRGVNNIYWILTFAVPLFFVLAVWATASFQYNDFAWNFMDKLVSNRLTLGHEAMQKYEIPLWGQFIKMYGGADSGIYYNYIDSSYIQLLLIYGLVYTVLYLTSFFFISYKAYRRHDYPLVLAICIIAVSGLISEYMLSITMNPFLIALFAKHDSYTSPSYIQIVK